ncbi:MAG: SMC-Scp complex subunit ScpB [Chloroflexi bacterium RBG_16_64_43]|nr:MAG: SMC-Scp complex subunit ScpB [Chloroflexi bacterium RBG_16_64_43]
MSMNPESNGGLALNAQLESLLFVSAEPALLATLAEALAVTRAEVEAALRTLAEEYAQRGLQILRIGDRIHLTTSPRAAGVVEKFLGLGHTTSLSKAALETLAILAYRQPLTRPQVDAIRGVNCDSVLQSLLAKGLVEEIGRTEGPGRPILYGLTTTALQHFGLSSVEDLPPLEIEEAPPMPAEPVAPETVLKG